MKKVVVEMDSSDINVGTVLHMYGLVYAESLLSSCNKGQRESKQELVDPPEIDQWLTQVVSKLPGFSLFLMFVRHP